jgi:hypothetical protein
MYSGKPTLHSRGQNAFSCGEHNGFSFLWQTDFTAWRLGKEYKAPNSGVHVKENGGVLRS